MLMGLSEGSAMTEGCSMVVGEFDPHEGGSHTAAVSVSIMLGTGARGGA